MNEEKTGNNGHTDPEVIDSNKPLWRTTLQYMRANGLTFGSVYDTKWLENSLAVPADSIQFVAGICHINTALKPEGYILRSRGMKGKGYAVVIAANAEDVARHWARVCLARLSDSISYVGGVLRNDLAVLDQHQRLRLEKLGEKAAVRYSLWTLSKQSHVGFIEDKDGELKDKKAKA